MDVRTFDFSILTSNLRETNEKVSLHLCFHMKPTFVVDVYIITCKLLNHVFPGSIGGFVWTIVCSVILLLSIEKSSIEANDEM